jgi:predicted nucleic acid-binding protein
LLQPADAQVFALAKAERFEKTVLTDDLALRRRIEAQNGIAVGSIGILIRAYRIGQLQRSELDEAIEALFQHSTLYLSRPFRAYIQRLLESLL